MRQPDRCQVLGGAAVGSGFRLSVFFFVYCDIFCLFCLLNLLNDVKCIDIFFQCFFASLFVLGDLFAPTFCVMSTCGL